VGALPIRLRLTLAFALAMAAVLAALGAFLYVRLASSLEEAIDEGLEARAAETVALVERGDSRLVANSTQGDQDERFAQLLDSDGAIVAATPAIDRRPLLMAEEVVRVLGEGASFRTRGAVPGVEGEARLLAGPVEAPAGRLVLVVGASLEERDGALQELLGELVLVGPGALLLASLLAYALATAALRPVEAMRAEASTISAADPGRRLPLPTPRDEVRRLGETLNEMLARLEGALERERTFVADASHELRTPLALLQAELELALRRPRTTAELEQALRSASVEADRLTRLAEDLLVLARSDRGALPFRRALFPAGKLLSAVAKRFGARTTAAGRFLDVEPSDGLSMSGDALLLEQALGSLVDNALRHGGGGIRLSAVERDRSVEVHVLDEGAGFPPQFLPGAFERFSRAEEARSGGGAGLGLAIVEAIARAHGGSARACNREGGGADVWLSIPKS
jgi:two-component system, OmpR family, sensor kinase